LIDKVDIDLYRVKNSYTKNQDDFKKTNKAMLCMLQHKASGKHLVVGNLQLYHGTNHDYVRQA